MRLTNCTFQGRFKLENGKKVNVYKGRKIGYNYDVLYYLYRGKRNIISDFEFSKAVEVSNG